MVRTRRPSQRMLALLAALLEEARGWIHGYELMKVTGLKSGSLYPLLIRTTALDLVEAIWREPTVPERSPRRAYRLAAKGLAVAIEAKAAPLPSEPAGARI